MTNELNDLVPAQEKLEWVTPKISLMDAGDSDAKILFQTESKTGWAIRILGRPAGPS